jgi:hypothetical protein
MSVLVIILYFRKLVLNQFEGMHGAWTLVDDMPGFYPCGMAATTSATPRQLREHLVLRHLTQITKPSPSSLMAPMTRLSEPNAVAGDQALQITQNERVRRRVMRLGLAKGSIMLLVVIYDG